MLRFAVVFALDTFAVEIIAHRGASHDALENTLAAVSLGWERNVDAVEMDVYLSKDNQIVVIHDKNTKRTAGHDGLVREMNWAQLRKLDAGSWKDRKFKGEPIPLLSGFWRRFRKGHIWSSKSSAGRRLFSRWRPC